MAASQLPDLFAFDGGGRVQTREDWQRRRAEIAASIVGLEYGGLPSSPAATSATLLCISTAPHFGDAEFQQYRVTIAQSVSFAFRLDVLIPPGPGPFPAIITGDSCWRLATDEVTREVLARGNILAQFSRVEIVADSETRGAEGLRLVLGGDYGAIAAWAWGYHRVTDILVALPEVNPAQIVVVGHSRGGKAALLAGATDERIALTCANQSGCGGAGCFREQGPGSETLADILKNFPYWFGPRLRDYIAREDALPFDQHGLKALVAPRALLTTEALGDPWANPSGTWQSHLAAREAYRFLGAEDKIAIRFREGAHDQTLADWQTLLDFMDDEFRGREPIFQPSPFADLPPAFSWQAPS